MIMKIAARPKISVVTPSFNQAEFLEETMQSVLGQNYPELEYVVIDGGSTDGSAEIIERYSDKLHYWISEKDAGHGDAINKGFSQTNGEIMAWINSDDKYTPWAFSVVADIFTQFPHVSWIVGFNAWWNENGVMTTARRWPKNIHDYSLGNYQWIQQESVFWRRSLWDKAGSRINTDYRLMVDGELWSRFFLHDELYSVDCILGGYRIHSSNRANLQLDSCSSEMEQIIENMMSKCPAELIEIQKSLRFAQKIQGLPGFRHLPVSELFKNLLSPSAFQKASYKNIHFLDGSWKERTLPFSVRNG